MKSKFIPFIVLLAPSSGLLAQSTPLTAASYVTEIVTDYGGYWRSGTGSGTNAAVSGIRPDNSHHLLAFVVNSGTTTVNGTQLVLSNKYFATGVNNTALTTNGLLYTDSKYEALPLGSSVAAGSSTKVGLGQLYDGVSGGASTPPPAAGYAQYLTDGIQGLNLGTGVANLPVGTITFNVSGIAAAAIGDGVPDILITQFASPSSVIDSYQFLDAAGTPVSGTKSLSANFSNVPVVGKWVADFYEATTPMTLTSGFTNTERDLRLLAVDFSVFGITSSNYLNIRQFQISLSGDSDQAFIAYNSNAATIKPLPVVLTSFTGQAQGNAVRLRWATASELHSDYFEVQASADGRAFEAVGRVAAAGSTAQARQYTFGHQPAGGGPHYYRLRQLDLDGTAHYSPTVVVRTGAAAAEVYPTLVAGQLHVYLPAPDAATLSLLAADGRLVARQQLPAAATESQATVLEGLAALPAGLYLLRVEVAGQAAVYRVQKE